MKNTTRTALRLLIATPLAASAVALGAGVAQADDSQGFSLQADVVHPDPKPQGPGDIAMPTPGDDPKSTGPGDIANPEPKDPKPTGPGDIANPEPKDPKPTGPGDITNPDGGDEPGPQIPGDKAGPNPGKGEDAPKDAPQGAPKADQGPQVKGGNLGHDAGGAAVADSDDVRVPSRIDAGFAPVEDQGPDMELMWVLAGGGVVTAAGSLLARRRTANG